MVNSQTVVLALRENQKIISRVRDAKGRQEYLLSKGSLLGYNAGRVEKRYPISYPEKWRKTEFAHERNYDSKTGSFTVQTTGPSKTEDVYEMPFNADNVAKLYEKVEDDDCQFILEDLRQMKLEASAGPL